MRRIIDRDIIDEYVQKSDFASYFDLNVSSVTELLVFSAGEHLIKEGKRSRWLLFLVSGRIKYYTTSGNGKYIPFGGSKGFRVLGEVSSLWGRDPLAGVQAVEESLCLAIDLEEHREDLFNDNRFLRYLCQTLAGKVALLDNNLTAFMGNPVEERVAAFIMQNLKGDVFDCTLVDCSESIGASYRHLLRIIGNFCERGLLRKQGRRYQVVDPEALSALAAETFGFFD